MSTHFVIHKIEKKTIFLKLQKTYNQLLCTRENAKKITKKNNTNINILSTNYISFEHAYENKINRQTTYIFLLLFF